MVSITLILLFNFLILSNFSYGLSVSTFVPVIKTYSTNINYYHVHASIIDDICQAKYYFHHEYIKEGCYMDEDNAKSIEIQENKVIKYIYSNDSDCVGQFTTQETSLSCFPYETINVSVVLSENRNSIGSTITDTVGYTDRLTSAYNAFTKFIPFENYYLTANIEVQFFKSSTLDLGKNAIVQTLGAYTAGLQKCIPAGVYYVNALTDESSVYYDLYTDSNCNELKYRTQYVNSGNGFTSSKSIDSTSMTVTSVVAFGALKRPTSTFEAGTILTNNYAIQTIVGTLPTAITNSPTIVTPSSTTTITTTVISNIPTVEVSSTSTTVSSTSTEVSSTSTTVSSTNTEVTSTSTAVSSTSTEVSSTSTEVSSTSTTVSSTNTEVTSTSTVVSSTSTEVSSSSEILLTEVSSSLFEDLIPTTEIYSSTTTIPTTEVSTTLDKPNFGLPDRPGILPPVISIPVVELTSITTFSFSTETTSSIDDSYSIFDEKTISIEDELQSLLNSLTSTALNDTMTSFSSKSNSFTTTTTQYLSYNLVTLPDGRVLSIPKFIPVVVASKTTSSITTISNINSSSDISSSDSISTSYSTPKSSIDSTNDHTNILTESTTTYSTSTSTNGRISYSSPTDNLTSNTLINMQSVDNNYHVATKSSGNGLKGFILPSTMYLIPILASIITLMI